MLAMAAFLTCQRSICRKYRVHMLRLKSLSCTCFLLVLPTACCHVSNASASIFQLSIRIPSWAAAAAITYAGATIPAGNFAGSFYDLPVKLPATVVLHTNPRSHHIRVECL